MTFQQPGWILPVLDDVKADRHHSWLGFATFLFHCNVINNIVARFLQLWPQRFVLKVKNFRNCKPQIITKNFILLGSNGNLPVKMMADRGDDYGK